MKLIKLKNGREINLPHCWLDLKLKHRNQFDRIVNEHKDNALEFQLAIIEMFNPSFNADVDLLDLKLSDFNVVGECLQFLMHTPEYKDMNFVFELNGAKYGLIQKFNQMSLAEWIDTTILTRTEEDVNSNIHLILAILYREVKKEYPDKKYPYNYKLKKYDIITIEERADIFMENMPYLYIMPALLFISATEISCLKTIGNCSVAPQKEKVTFKIIMKTLNPIQNYRNFKEMKKQQNP